MITNSTKTPFDIDVYDTRVTYSEGFYYEEIPDSIVSKITDVSYPKDCPFSLDELRYCSVLYVDFDGEEQYAIKQLPMTLWRFSTNFMTMTTK